MRYGPHILPNTKYFGQKHLTAGLRMHNTHLRTEHTGKELMGHVLHDVRTEWDLGVGPNADNSTARLRECYNDKGRGGRNPKNFAYVICTCHLASCLFLCKVAIAPAKAPHARAHCGVAGKRALCYAVFHPRPANCARTSLYGGYYGPSFPPLQDLCLVSEVYACV